ncbi:MAG TPA: RNA polymerase sigma factor [Gemmatimonadaceae bacterium]
MSDSPSDAALIRRFLNGEEAAFRALYERHTPRLKMTVRRLLGFRQQEMDDVVQETWLAACRGLVGYRGEAPFGAWVTAIGARTTYATLTRLTSRDESPVSDDYPAPEIDALTPTLDIERALDALPDTQRMVVVLHDIEGLTHHEIAEQLGMAAGTSKATLFRARRVLRAALNGGMHNAAR